MRAFQPAGKTILFTANTSAPTGVKPDRLDTPSEVSGQFRIHNATTVTVFVAFGTSAAIAAAAAVIPTGTAQSSYPVAAGSTEVFTAPIGSFFSGITASGSGSVFVTPGHGL